MMNINTSMARCGHTCDTELYLVVVLCMLGLLVLIYARFTIWIDTWFAQRQFPKTLREFFYFLYQRLDCGFPTKGITSLNIEKNGVFSNPSMKMRRFSRCLWFHCHDKSDVPSPWSALW